MWPISILLLRLIYGDEEYERLYKKGSIRKNNTIQILISIAFVFWLLAILFLATGTAAKDKLICIIYVIAFPCVIIISTIMIRNKYQNNNTLLRIDSSESNNTQDSRDKRKEYVRFCKHCGNSLSENSFFCNKCGAKAVENNIEK